MRGLTQHQLFTFLIQFTLLLASARAMGALARRLKQPQVIGELLAGFVLGPAVLGYFFPALEHTLFPEEQAQRQLLELLSWVGMILLLLRAGLDTDLRLLRSLGKVTVLASIFGILLPFGVGFVVAQKIPDSLLASPETRHVFALFIGIAMSISAVTVTAKILLDLKLTRRNVGMTIMGASVTDDILGWVLLAIASSVATSGTVSSLAVGKALGATGLFLGTAFLLGRRLIPQLLGRIDRLARLEHARISSIIILAFLFAACTERLGLHAVLGAFVAGVIVAESPRIRQTTLDTLESLVMGVFAPIFFAYSGLRITSAALPPLAVTALVLGGAIGAKVVGAGLGARLGGLRQWESLAIGIGMSARGSMELVVARIGLEMGIFSSPIYNLIVLIPIVTSITTPLGLRLVLKTLPPDAEEAERLGREEKEERAVIKRAGLRILVPTRCSPFSLQALRFAVPLANTPGSTLVAMSVLPSPDEHPPERRRPNRRDGLTSDGFRSCMEEFAAREPVPDFHPQLVTNGDPEKSILEEAARGYDLVFLGVRRPRTLSASLLVGLLEQGVNDVVIVRGVASPLEARSILVPTVGAFFSLAAAELAVVYGKAAGARVEVLQVIDTTNASRATQAELRALGQQSVDEIVDKVSQPGVRIESLVSSSRFPPRRILDTADEYSADFIVLGVTPKVLGHRAFFGQTVDFILAHARCAVVLYIPRARDSRPGRSTDRT